MGFNGILRGFQWDVHDNGTLRGYWWDFNGMLMDVVVAYCHIVMEFDRILKDKKGYIISGFFCQPFMTFGFVKRMGCTKFELIVRSSSCRFRISWWKLFPHIPTHPCEWEGCRVSQPPINQRWVWNCCIRQTEASILDEQSWRHNRCVICGIWHKTADVVEPENSRGFSLVSLFRAQQTASCGVHWGA